MLLVAHFKIIYLLPFIDRLEDKLDQKVLYTFHCYDLFKTKVLQHLMQAINISMLYLTPSFQGLLPQTID